MVKRKMSAILPAYFVHNYMSIFQTTDDFVKARDHCAH